MEQLSLFFEEAPTEAEAICLFHGERAIAKKPEDWMTKLIPEGKYAVMVGRHPLVLRPVRGDRAQVQKGHEFYHYMINGRLYAGVFVGGDVG